MANEKGGNNYTPIKNPELFQGQPDTRDLSQRMEDGKKEEAKKDNETWVEQAKRTTPKEKSTMHERLKNSRQQINEKSEISKDEPEKDK